MNNRGAFITGASGFLGSTLINCLIRNNWRVAILVREGSDSEYLRDDIPGVERFVYRGNIGSIVTAFKEFKPNVVFHLATFSTLDHSPDDVDELMAANLIYGNHVLEAMCVAGISVIVNAGTYWQNFDGHNYSPVNLYAATKQAFQCLLQYYLEVRNISGVTLKIYDTFGVGDKRLKIINFLKKAAQNNMEISMTPGEQLIDLVHIDDVAMGFIVAANHLISGGGYAENIYALRSGEPVSLKNLVAEIEGFIGKKLKIIWGGRPYRHREVMLPWEGAVLPNWRIEKSRVEALREVFGGQ